jgi:hypothetical protein
LEKKLKAEGNYQGNPLRNLQSTPQMDEFEDF